MKTTARLLATLLVAAIIAGCSERNVAPTQPQRDGVDPTSSIGSETQSKKKNSKRKSKKKSRKKGMRNYMVTIENMTSGQPLSPPVAATHSRKIRMFEVGERASRGLEAIAEDGNQGPMFMRFSEAKKGVTDAVDVGRPLTPKGSSAGGFSSVVSFMIKGHKGDRLSLATMLICTNDGFTGLDAVKLPKQGEAVYWTNAYDAGTERNTQRSSDIVDPCSGIGPVPLKGDPNGNENLKVDSNPHKRIRHHRGIRVDKNDLVKEHAWSGPITRVTIKEVR